jgi:hypothetical protein
MLSPSVKGVCENLTAGVSLKLLNLISHINKNKVSYTLSSLVFSVVFLFVVFIFLLLLFLLLLLMLLPSL